MEINFYEYDKVKTLNGTDILYKERGVIAQELQNGPLDYSVRENDILNKDQNTESTKILSVNYNNIFITLCQAFKDQQNIINNYNIKLLEITNKNTELREKNKILENQVNTINTSVNELVSKNYEEQINNVNIKQLELTNKYTEVTNKNIELTEKNRELTEKNKILENQVNTINTSVDELVSKKYEVQINNVNIKNIELTNKNRILENLVNTMKNSLNELLITNGKKII